MHPYKNRHPVNIDTYCARAEASQTTPFNLDRVMASTSWAKKKKRTFESVFMPPMTKQTILEADPMSQVFIVFTH